MMNQSKMRISAILIKNYRQFRHVCLNLTDPDTHQPLDKICLIGANGTGKSTLLLLISQFLQTGVPSSPNNESSDVTQLPVFSFKIDAGASNEYLVIADRYDAYALPVEVEKSVEWRTFWNTEMRGDALSQFKNFLTENSNKALLEKFKLQPNGNDLAIYAPPDGSSPLNHSGLPNTNLSNALTFFKQLPAFHRVAYDKLEGFWNTLIYQIKKRESDYQQFLQASETQSLSVAEARRKFDATHPEILKQLAKQWNLILAQAGLEFDVENAKIPVQLSENLEAYIRFKASQTQLPYSVLSTGVRNFIFRFGHIYALYFNRKIERGFLLLDEPEASLFPDLLYDIIDRYLSVIQNSQFFVATQSPIIAAQFRPCERIILTFDKDGYVHSRHGVSAEGDDPNDLLMQDFAVRSLYGKKGIEQWNRYRALRRQIPTVNDPAQKKALLDEYTKIGNAYNFASHEIPT